MTRASVETSSLPARESRRSRMYSPTEKPQSMQNPR